MIKETSTSRLEASKQTHNKEEPMNNKAKNVKQGVKRKVENMKSIECDFFSEIGLKFF